MADYWLRLHQLVARGRCGRWCQADESHLQGLAKPFGFDLQAKQTFYGDFVSLVVPFFVISGNLVKRDAENTILNIESKNYLNIC